MDYDEDALAAFCRRWEVAELAVFGSAARNALPPDSDIDFMVRFLPNARVNTFDLVTMKDQLTEMFGRDVDLVTPAILVNPFRRRSIEPDLKVVYSCVRPSSSLSGLAPTSDP